MSLEQKIAQLMEEAKKVNSIQQEEVSEEIVAEEVVEEELSNDIAEEEEVDEAVRLMGKTSETGAPSVSKHNMKEGVEPINLDGLFEGEEISEEFKAKVVAVFEAAVEARVKQEVESLAEELVEHSLTESEQLKEGLVDKVDGYLDYVVEQWMQKNELALDRGIKVEIFESFVSGMKDLFESHYIEVPEEKIDLMEEVDHKAKELEEKLDSVIAENVELHNQLKKIAKEQAIMEAVEGLSDLEAERLKQLAEELAYDDAETFGEKLSVIKENFAKSPKAKPIVESVVTDSPVELNEETQIDPRMKRYVSAIKG